MCVQPAPLVGLCLFVFSVSCWNGVFGSDQKNVGDVVLLVHCMAQLVDVEGKPFSQARDSCCHEGCPALGRWVRAEGAGRLGYGYANRNIQAQQILARNSEGVDIAHRGTTRV